MVVAVLKGYLDPPVSHQLHRSRTNDDKFLAKCSGQNMSLTLQGQLPQSGRCGKFARAVRPEAVEIAERNQRGTVCFDNRQSASTTEIGQQNGRRGLRSEAAVEIAQKYQQGSVGMLLS